MPINVMDLCRAVSLLEGALKDIGVFYIKISDDIDLLHSAVQESQKGVVGEHFRITLNTLTPPNVFWAGAYTKKGKCRATIACRFDDLGRRSLDDHLDRYWQRVYRSEDGRPVRFKPRALEFANQINGKVAYFGEAFTHPEWRGKNILPSLHKLLVLQAAYSEFAPTHIYGWMPRAIAKNAIDWGYTKVRPIRGAFQVPPPYKSYLDLCYVGMDCPDDVDAILNNPLEHLEDNEAR